METALEPGAPIAPQHPRRRRFVVYHKWDRNFFLTFLALCWLGVLMGFEPALAKRAAGHAEYPAPLILQIHAVAFSCWLALLTVQIGLIRMHRPRLHMKLGLIGFALVPIMAVTAFFSEVYSQRFHFAHPPNSQAFFIIAIFYVVGFTTLATAALSSRAKPAAHKRLSLLATTIIVGAAYTRWSGNALYEAFGDGLGGMLINTYTPTNLLMAGAVAYDLWTRRRLHPVYEVAVPLILLGEIATTFIYHSPRWLPIAHLAI
jgi:uncharacterized membrane protein